MTAGVTIVVIRAYHAEGRATELARASLDGNGRVTCTDADLLAQWTAEGIVGRSDRGPLYPKDGRAFLEELPFVYKSPYMHAEAL